MTRAGQSGEPRGTPDETAPHRSPATPNWTGATLPHPLSVIPQATPGTSGTCPWKKAGVEGGQDGAASRTSPRKGRARAAPCAGEKVGLLPTQPSLSPSLHVLTPPYTPLPPSKHRHTGLSGAARACHETSPHPRLSHPRCPPAPGGSTTRPGPPRPPPAAFAAAAARHHHGDRHGSGPVRRDSHRDCDRGNERRSRRRRRRPARRRRRRRPRPGSERALHPHEQLPLPARPDVPAVLFDPSHRNVCVRVICWSEDKRRRERGRA